MPIPKEYYDGHHTMWAILSGYIELNESKTTPIIAPDIESLPIHYPTDIFGANKYCTFTTLSNEVEKAINYINWGTVCLYDNCSLGTFTEEFIRRFFQNCRFASKTTIIKDITDQQVYDWVIYLLDHAKAKPPCIGGILKYMYCYSLLSIKLAKLSASKGGTIMSCIIQQILQNNTYSLTNEQLRCIFNIYLKEENLGVLTKEKFESILQNLKVKYMESYTNRTYFSTRDQMFYKMFKDYHPTLVSKLANQVTKFSKLDAWYFLVVQCGFPNEATKHQIKKGHPIAKYINVVEEIKHNHLIDKLTDDVEEIEHNHLIDKLTDDVEVQ